jgi:EAL domain-containing protein (putative c-di-GMP-specific phosphodiesterase class I)
MAEYVHHGSLKVQVLLRTGLIMEVINYNDGNPVIVPHELLQDKSKRYFFRDTFMLSQGEVYVSPLDLNVEENQLEIAVRSRILSAHLTILPRAKRQPMRLNIWLFMTLLLVCRIEGCCLIGLKMQVDDQRRALGAEALIRWNHPEHGLIPPIKFISLAEETGLILPIGQWVLETACAQIAAWQLNAGTQNLVLAVNVSVKQFREANFVTHVQAAVQRHGINPMLLKLELTESMLMDDTEGTIATMSALKKLGCQISLDDFGTGYSSLQYLKRLLLDQLKIDQSFVRDLSSNESDRSLVRTIIAMAHSLKLNVIAEGVETDEQRQILMRKRLFP